jgi:hypothetical protein
MANEGLGGAFLLAVGGTILFYSLYVFLWDSFHNVLSMPVFETSLYTFIGFLIFGIGLWQIVKAGKPETKQNPSL